MFIKRLFKHVTAVDLVESLLSEAESDLEATKGNVVVARDQLNYYEGKLTQAEARVLHLRSEITNLNKGAENGSIA